MTFYPQQSGSIAVQTTNLLSLRGTKRRLDVGYRIPRSFFIFTRDTSSRDEHAFLAQAQVTVEIVDTNKGSVAREYSSRKISSQGTLDPSADTASLSGGYSFNLEPGTYFVTLEVNDKNSSRKFPENARRITLKDFSRSTLEISDAMFVELPSGDEPNKLVPFNIGGDVPFGPNARCYIQIYSTLPRESVTVACRLTHQNPDGEVPGSIVSDTLARDAFASAKALNISSQEERYVYSISDTLVPNSLACWIDMRTDSLEQGAYQLEITARAAGSVSSLKKNFQLRWLSMPISLRQLKFAVESMECLLSEKEFNQYRSANPKEQRKLFDTYWKRRDPIPQTAFNEVMAEYYKRVDYAFTAFSTIGQQNGVKTERGKAYILYGPPASIERKLLPSSDPQEIWLYTNLHKKLTFIDEHRNGNYKLVTAESF